MIELFLLSLAFAIVSSLFGVFTTLRRETFYIIGISHGAFAGAAIGVVLGTEPLLVAFLYSLFLSFLIHKLSDSNNREAFVGVSLSFSMALGIALMYISGKYVDALSYLFGSILIAYNHFLLLSFALAISVIWLLKNWRKIYYISFDEEYCMALGENVKAMDLEFLVMVSLLVVVGMKVAGALLTSALMVLPATTSLLFRLNIKRIFLLSILLSSSSVLLGLGLSIYLDIPPGPSIILILSVFFSLLYLFNALTVKGR